MHPALQAALVAANLTQLPEHALVWSPDSVEITAFRDVQQKGWYIPETEIFSQRWTISNIGPDAAVKASEVDACFFTSVTPQVNILRCLDLARATLSEQGCAIVTFAPSENQKPARLPRWKEYWQSIGERVGFNATSIEGLSGWIFTRDSKPRRWRLKVATPDDFPNFAKLFHAVYGSWPERSLWEWKYGGGRGNAVLAYRGDELIAHYGAIARRILTKGREDWAMQVGDVMVHPAERAVFSRRGAFFLTTVTWAEMYGPLDYGLPSRRSMRLGERLGIYQKSGCVVQLRWKFHNNGGGRNSVRFRHIHSPENFESYVSKLWGRMRKSTKDLTLCVRDWGWLKERYIEHPIHRYEFLVIKRRFFGGAIGIAVIRRNLDEFELIDIIGDKKNFSRIISEVIEQSRGEGCRELFMWIEKSHLPCFLNSNPICEGTEFEIPTDGWTKTRAALSLIGNWWITSGDTDYR